MKFQTNISILNDHFDWIQKNPETFVEGIAQEMNWGNESLVEATRPPRSKHAITSHYVTVHKAQHADVQQVTYTHANSSYDVWDVTRGIQLGYLDTATNPDTHIQIYQQIARELRRQAADLSKAIKDYQAEAARQLWSHGCTPYRYGIGGPRMRSSQWNMRVDDLHHLANERRDLDLAAGFPLEIAKKGLASWLQALEDYDVVNPVIVQAVKRRVIL